MAAAVRAEGSRAHLWACGSHCSTWWRTSGCRADNGGGQALGSALQAARFPAPPLRARGLDAIGLAELRKTCQFSEQPPRRA